MNAEGTRRSGYRACLPNLAQQLDLAGADGDAVTNVDAWAIEDGVRFVFFLVAYAEAGYRKCRTVPRILIHHSFPQS
ncbi:MAG: hypothetical protein ACUVSD_12280 [Thiobacillaceae bacterium]